MKRIDPRVPCKDCPSRTIPKTCETTCEKWARYKEELEKERTAIQSAKMLEKAVNRQIWRNSRNG